MSRFYFNGALRRVALVSAVTDRSFRQLDAVFFSLTCKVAGLLSVDYASAAGDAIGRRLGPRLRQHENVLRNLRLAFPDRDEAWFADIARSIWGRIFSTLAEYPHLPAIAGESGEPRIEVVPCFDLGPAQRGEQRLMIVAIHQANWNVHAIAGHVAQLPGSVLVVEQANKQLEPVVSRYRNRMPCGFIDVGEGLHGVLRALDRGHHIGTFVDVRDEAQPMVPFVGHPTRTTIWPARLALKLGLALVPVQLERLKGARFRATFHPPLQPDPSLSDPRQAALEMTARLNAQFEQWIRECPEDWICAKRRWPVETWKRRRDELLALGRLPEHYRPKVH
jgi:Kdo2-lipid IVA lauroyltransferase/acyltransferase